MTKDKLQLHTWLLIGSHFLKLLFAFFGIIKQDEASCVIGARMKQAMYKQYYFSVHYIAAGSFFLKYIWYICLNLETQAIEQQLRVPNS